MDDKQPARPVVSIIVKALNEERRIQRCLDAAVREAGRLGGEVILVDSLSTDRTVELASQYNGVRIVQFLSQADISCGAAVQLGYQYARGEFIYILDADMVLQDGFLDYAMERLAQDPLLAGVGGKIIDTQIKTLADKRRVVQANALISDVVVGELGGGGLYKREAIDSVRYLSNRYFRAYEEADLGVRLRVVGWKLLRVSRASVLHEGHLESNWRMLIRLWKNGRASATGMFIRSSLFRPWFFLVVRKLSHVYSVAVMHLGQFFPVVAAPEGSSFVLWLGYWLILFLIMILKKKGFKTACWSLLLWHYLAWASCMGFFSRLKDPEDPICSKIIKDNSNELPCPK